MLRPLALLAVLLAGLSALHAEPAGDDWWNAAWSHRKRARVRLAPEEPLGFAFRPPQSAGADDLVAAEARIRCEVPLQAGAQREIRVVDAGGSVLPCAADDPDARGLVAVTFPARRTIAAQLASPIQEGTPTATLSVGRDKAVTPGTRFYAMSGQDRVATLEVTSVDASTSVARVVEKSAAAVPQGARVESEVLAADYSIYYGNPKADAGPARWTPTVTAVSQFAWRLTGGEAPTSVQQLRAVMRAAPAYVGTHAYSQIASTGNPFDFDADTYYISVYESYIYCDLGGIYRFSIDSGGPAFLLIDGKLAAQRAGFFYQTGQFEHRGKIELERGYHHLALCATESGKRYVTRLAWQPVTGTVYTLAPPSLFVNRIEAEVVGFETRDRQPQVFFTCRLAPFSLLAEKGKAYQFVQFHNLTPLPAQGNVKEVTYQWDFGDGQQVREEEPGHLYPVSAGVTPASFPVTLQVTVDGKPAGQYQRTAYCDPRPQQKLNLALDIVSFANIVYYDERTSIAVRLRNASYSPVILRAVARLESPEARQVILNSAILLDAMGESFCILPVDMKLLPDKSASVDLDIALDGQRVLGTRVRILPADQLMRLGKKSIAGAQITGEMGALFDEEGRRVMISAEIEDPDRHLEWVFARWLHEKHLASHRRILLFGDRMANLVAPDKSFTDYVALLEERMKKANRPFHFVPRSTGLLPTLADIVLFAKTLQALKPPPDVIVLCPGLADVNQAVGERDFARSFDVMIDCVRATGHATRLILVSPPPCPRNVRVSRLYTEALERVARDHHVLFLNLDELLAKGQDDWLKACYATPDADGICFENPNEATQRRIADAIEKLLLE